MLSLSHDIHRNLGDFYKVSRVSGYVPVGTYPINLGWQRLKDAASQICGWWERWSVWIHFTFLKQQCGSVWLRALKHAAKYIMCLHVWYFQTLHDVAPGISVVPFRYCAFTQKYDFINHTYVWKLVKVQYLNGTASSTIKYQTLRNVASGSIRYSQTLHDVASGAWHSTIQVLCFHI